MSQDRIFSRGFDSAKHGNLVAQDEQLGIL